MISKNEFLKLYPKYLAGQCTQEEIELLESYQDDLIMPDNKWKVGFGSKKQLHKTLKAKVNKSISQPVALAPVYNRSWFKVAVVAVISLSVCLAIWQSSQKKPLKANPVANKPVNILPGGNKAYLTLANGSVITLNNLKNGTLATKSGVQISKVKDGVLKYNYGSEPGENTHPDELAYNTINIPRGGTYKVVLSDGTKVWLNSASSLKYPEAFYGNERKVELTGEAYFEVAKNKAKPFKVNVNGISVQVLGTHFNINGYNDEKEVKTTLLEGSVKLVARGSEALLKPGQQGELNMQQTSFNIKNVDIDDVVAWKNGFFAFNDEDIQTIMKNISRWYDVDVIFPENFKRRNFGGTVSRFKDVSQVLNALELTGSIHFKIEGRRITVMR